MRDLTAAAAAPKRTPWWRHLYVQVLAGIALGTLVGAIWPTTGEGLKPLGDAFIAIVKMIIAPVIFLTLVTGIANMRDLGSVGRVMLKALSYFLLLSTAALILGLIVANATQIGASMHIDPATLDTAAVAKYTQQAHDQTITGFLLHIIPKTIVSPLASGEILQVLLVAVLTGISLALIGKEGDPLLRVLESANQLVFRMVHMLMKLAPIGAFGAIAFTIGKYGVGSLASLAALVGTFYITSLLFVLVVLGGVGWLFGFSILKLIRYLKDELFLVLGTSSSEAALPSLLEKMERAGCSKQVVGLVVPAGYSFNLDGTNIYMTLAALFIAHATGTPLSFGEQLLLLGVAMLSSKGAAGVTGAGFITLAATLSVVPSVPVAGMALILGIDRFMSECRSLTNFVGNAVATIVVAKWDGEFDAELFDRAMHGAPASIEEVERKASTATG
ncbi:dicarboxylate/amino acid:cation symporter [Sphingosinithalassobacter portus]|uniref:dicarboxylate/amino acid:cation symporter n=1 Tax=Stakelama portus TaxID=2676234 RepID=UPI001EFC301B|nr:dicarboxylate/amino acid:cation symporter [Sphingosinithalassobacter portus]